MGGLTVAAVMGMGLGLVLWASVQFLKLDDAAGMVALAALLFAIAAPITHRVQAHVERLLRSAAYDPGRLLADFTARASTSNHMRDVLAQLDETLRKSINPTFFELYRLDRVTNRLLPQTRPGGALDVDSTLTVLLENSEPSVIDDEMPAPTPIGGAALTIRLAVANEPAGLLVVGQKSDRIPFEGSDVAFVASLAGPLAAALVNTLAYEAVETMNRALEARVQVRTVELEQKNRELAELNVRKDELVATVSHDFRSPLAIIRQNVQTMLRDLPRIDRDDLRMFLEGISRQEDRLTSLCMNLLDLARLKERGAARDPVELVELVRTLVEGFAVKAQAGAVQIVVDNKAGARAVVRGDRDRLGQVLQNLIDNALKFTPKGGSITVRLVRDHHKLVVDVADTGCGVPADALPRLFEPFYQVPRTTHVGQGSGLGLAIVKAVLEAHGGTIAVDSVEAQGTTFTVRLDVEPLASDDAPAIAAE